MAKKQHIKIEDMKVIFIVHGKEATSEEVIEHCRKLAERPTGIVNTYNLNTARQNIKF